MVQDRLDHGVSKAVNKSVPRVDSFVTQMQHDSSTPGLFTLSGITPKKAFKATDIPT